jgi:dTDP-glucose 4,6-dehydratase
MLQFVTGAAGFIGSNYVRYALENSDDEIIIYDALTYAGNMSTINALLENPRVKFVHGNICDSKNLVDSIKGVNIIVNFAAESHVDRSIAGADDFVMTNCYGTNKLLSIAKHEDALDLFIHISTDEVYGSVEVGSSLEIDPLDPRSPYSASKAASDLLALAYHSTFGLPVIVTRCSNNFGPYQYPEKAIPLFITNLMQGKNIPVYGDGLNERDWLFVDDHCSAIDAVMQNGKIGEIYNIGAGNETKNIDLVLMILQIMKKGAYRIQFVEDRKGHDRRYSVNTNKITALGWSRKRSLQEALEETIRWYVDNQWWWEPLVPKC